MSSADQPSPEQGDEQSPRDLPQEWWYDLDDATFDALFDEARLRVAEIREFISQRERRVALIIAWSFALLGAARLAQALDPGSGLSGVLSWIALIVTVLEIGCAFWHVVPHPAHIGVDLRWLAAYARELSHRRLNLRTERLLRGEALAEMLAAHSAAVRDVERRSPAYLALSWLAPLQAAAVAAVVIAHFA